jgi:chaperonin cofactor prefoldin
MPLSDLLTAANEAEALQARLSQLVAQEAELRTRLQSVRREMNERQAALTDVTAVIKAAAELLS